MHFIIDKKRYKFYMLLLATKMEITKVQEVDIVNCILDYYIILRLFSLVFSEQIMTNVV